MKANSISENQIQGLRIMRIIFKLIYVVDQRSLNENHFDRKQIQENGMESAKDDPDPEGSLNIMSHLTR